MDGTVTSSYTLVTLKVHKAVTPEMLPYCNVLFWVALHACPEEESGILLHAVVNLS